MHDSMAGYGCGCGDAGCGTMPAEFVHVRYYFGQRLGVLELNDEAIYHTVKRAFHNARLHGAGVICGLRAERVAPPAGMGTKSTVLRVTRGAAIDPCGREVVVGIDQCIDVAAWFGKNKPRPPLQGWVGNTTQTLRVVVRYRECPSDPSPAPRDACGCDNGGCEFGRVREGFELALLTIAEGGCSTTAFPDSVAMLDAVHGTGPVGSGGDASGALKVAIDRIVADACPVSTDNQWLCLAAFKVTLDATPAVVDITEPDNAIAERRSLLGTGALQALVVDLLAQSAASGTVSAGPRAGALSFTPDVANPATAGTLTLPITLAMTPGSPATPAAPIPLVDPTFDPAAVRVATLDVTGWIDVTPPAADITLDSGVAPPVIKLVFAQDLSAGPLFRLTIDAPFAVPIVDVQGHPLARIARHFRFGADGAGALELASFA